MRIFCSAFCYLETDYDPPTCLFVIFVAMDSSSLGASIRQRRRARSAARKIAARTASQAHIEDLEKAHQKECKRHTKTILSLQKARDKMEASIQQSTLQLELQKSKMVASEIRLIRFIRKWEHAANYYKKERDTLRLQLLASPAPSHDAIEHADTTFGLDNWTAVSRTSSHVSSSPRSPCSSGGWPAPE